LIWESKEFGTALRKWALTIQIRFILLRRITNGTVFWCFVVFALNLMEAMRDFGGKGRLKAWSFSQSRTARFCRYVLMKPKLFRNFGSNAGHWVIFD